jgi:hypothetical protein
MKAQENILNVVVLRIKRRCFSYLKNFYLNVLLWRSKELRIDVEHSKALLDLKNKENSARDEEKTTLLCAIDELNEILRSKQLDLDAREADIFEKEKLVLTRNREKLDIETKLKQAQQNLEEKGLQLNALRNLEDQRVEEAEKQKRRMKFIEEEKNHQLSLLRDDRDRLRCELNEVQEQRRMSESNYRKQHEDDLLQLQNIEAVNASLSQKLLTKDTEVEQLEREKMLMREEIEKVQLRIRELTLQGCAMLDEVFMIILQFLVRLK